MNLSVIRRLPQTPYHGDCRVELPSLLNGPPRESSVIHNSLDEHDMYADMLRHVRQKLANEVVYRRGSNCGCRALGCWPYALLATGNVNIRKRDCGGNTDQIPIIGHRVSRVAFRPDRLHNRVC